MTLLSGSRISLCSVAWLLTTLLSTNSPAQTNYTVIHNFAGGSDGANPQARLAIDNAGRLYGITNSGGKHNLGTAFRLTPPVPPSKVWTESTLHSFAGGSDGSQPQAALLLDTAGNLYGTTQKGGAANQGIAFKLRRNLGGWQETVLHSFGTSTDDAVFPNTSLIINGSCSVFGTGLGGHFGFGAVFSLTDANGRWIETTLHSFDESDGYKPNDLAIDNAGFLYDTMQVGGGPGARGVVFMMTPQGPSWTERTIHTFTGTPDGAGPQSGLLLDHTGPRYGTTMTGGDFDNGIVFKLTPEGGGAWRGTNDGGMPPGWLGS